MTALPYHFDRHHVTWITTPAGAVCVRPLAGNRWAVTARNRGQHFVSGFELHSLVNEIVYSMGGVIRWNVDYRREPVSEGSAKLFFKARKPQIDWLSAVPWVLREPSTGRAVQWIWLARRPHLILAVEDMGSGRYSAWFQHIGEPTQHSLFNHGALIWPAPTVASAEYTAKDLLADALYAARETSVRESAQQRVDWLLEGPRFGTLKKGKVRLEPEERERAMKAGAVWHRGNQG